MKKFTSILLTICIVISAFNMFALAGESSTLSGSGQNNPNTDYIVAYNDFENVTGFTDGGGFSIADSGDPSYGKALKVVANGWGLANPGIWNATYTWNNTTHNVFNETIVDGDNYIISYQYCTTSELTGTGFKTENRPFIFAPQHDNLWSGKLITDMGDYINIPKYYSDNKWHIDTFSFTAGSTTDKNTTPNKINIKLNKSNTGVVSYIDNYIIMKAGEIVIDDPTASISYEIVSGDFILSTNPIAYNKKDTVALGSDIKFKLTSSNSKISPIVKMGEETLTPNQEGVYSVKITDDIIVTGEFDENVVSEKYSIDSNNNIYFEDKITANFFADSLKAPSSAYNVSHNGAEGLKDIWLTAGDKLSCVIGDGSYTVKYIGDVAEGGDGKWTVSDVVSMVSNILGTEESSLDKVAFDVNKSNRVTVSDVILLQNKILNIKEVTSADPEIVDNMDEFFEDVLERSGTTATEQDLINGIYNYGDRTRIANVIRKAMRGEQIKVVYFGGSITEATGGSSEATFTNSITETGGYAAWITRWFKKHFGEDSIDAFNAGIGSTDTPFGIHRMVEDVLEKEPDLVINEWSMNDNTLRNNYKQGTYEAVVRRLLENDIAVLLYGFTDYKGNCSEDVHKPVADYYDLPFVSEKMAFFHLNNFAKLTNDNTHPNMVGHALTGINMAYFFQKTYEDIANISETEPPMRKTYFHPEAHRYEGAYMVDLYDVYNANAEHSLNGVTIKDMGSFEFDTTLTRYGIGGFRSYYGATAKLAASYEPMVIEIESCKTLFILNLISSGITDGSYYIELNGEEIRDPEFNCSKGKKQDTNPEAGYHWATPPLMYDAESPSVELKIYPDMATGDPKNLVKLFSLLLS